MYGTTFLDKDLDSVERQTETASSARARSARSFPRGVERRERASAPRRVAG